MKTTIKTKIIVFSVALLLLVIILQLVFSVFMSKSFFVKEKKDQIEQLYSQLEEQYTDDIQHLDKITAAAQDVYNIKISISDSNRIIYSNVNMNEMGMMHQSMMVRPNHKFKVNNHSGWEDKADIMKLKGVIDNDGSPRYVILWTSVEPIDASVLMFTKTNIVISFIVLIVGAIFSYYFAGNLSKPVQQVEKVATNVANLRFDTLAKEDVSTLELHNLACSVNKMSFKLKEMIDSLYSANEKLQKDIDYQKQAEKMRKEFIANVSHEMKTPLCMLLMYSENLKNNVEGIDKDYYCQTIIDEANRLNVMVKSLLDLSSIENGLTKITAETIDFSQFCHSVVAKTDIFTQNFQVQVDIDEGISVQGDQYYLAQAINNYIMNAVSHTCKTGMISITLILKERKAVFSVFNSGSYIPPEDINHIWDSFYRGDKSRKRSENANIGLGLYVVKTIINAHGGTFGVENKNEGVEFWFALDAM